MNALLPLLLKVNIHILWSKFPIPRLIIDWLGYQLIDGFAGRYGCVGKNLAFSELRFVTALLVKKYAISFAPGEDGKTLTSELKDQFTAAPGELKLEFKLRDQV